MLLKGYRKEIFRPECNPSFQSLHCIAHLDQDVSEALPYLNATLGGFEYLKDPPAVTFRVHGKIITVHPRQIAVNALRDEEEAEKILQWLQREINEAWEKRDEIKPRYEGSPKPKVLEILKLLPADQLPGMRSAHVHGLCHPGGPGGEGLRGLSSLGRRCPEEDGRVHGTVCPGDGYALKIVKILPGIARSK